jgi:hypothetical protein
MTAPAVVTWVTGQCSSRQAADEACAPEERRICRNLARAMRASIRLPVNPPRSSEDCAGISGCRVRVTGIFAAFLQGSDQGENQGPALAKHRNIKGK